MDYYVISTCTELGLSQLLARDFPSNDHMAFIEWIMRKKSTDQALESKPEQTKDFEVNGLSGLLPAKEFFEKLKTVAERGSYVSASIRMDVQVATRVMRNAPDCKLNMHLKTTDWKKSLNMTTELCDKLLKVLEDTKDFIRQEKLAMKEQQE